jgi:hypothetical protein
MTFQPFVCQNISQCGYSTLFVEVGESMFQSVMKSIVSSALYGMYFLSVMIYIFFILNNSKSSSQNARFFLLGCTFFAAAALTTIYITLNGDLASTIVLQTSDFGNATPDIHVVFAWSEAIDLPYPIMIVLGDALVAWRACIIWPFSRYIKPILILLTIVHIVMQGASAIYKLYQDSHPEAPLLTGTKSLFDANMFGMIISLFINISATVLIILKAWKHKNQIQELGFRYKRVTKVQQVLLLWIECGFLFCSFQALYIFSIILQAFSTYYPFSDPLLMFGENANGWMEILIPYIVGLYPIAIYIMVALRSSVVEETLSLQTITAANAQPPVTDGNDGVEEQ